MASDDSCNMWVFREGRTTVSGKAAVAGLRSSLSKIDSACRRRDALVDALLRAGELECGLADVAAPDTSRAADITDAIAAELVECPGRPLDGASALLDAISVPASLNVSPQEGFAYYALHPLDYAELADEVPLPGAAAVVGIRTIGTSLSAVVASVLRRRGAPAERITVRPAGHPYDRHTTFTPEQLRWIAGRRAAEAEFLVADEGPGISGSSFLSVGEALLAAGVARERIRFLGSRYADPDKLAARDGAARWRSFQSMVTRPTRQTPMDCGAYLGGGGWRRHFCGDEPQWPASWVQMERLKFLSTDGRRIYKFHGLGRYGEAVAERARLLGEAGFGPRLLAHASGFSEFALVDGHPMDATRISAAALERVADYCALRAAEFAARPAQASQLEAMLRFNLGEALACQAGEWPAALNSDRLVIADGRMMPHEWLATPGGVLVKTDNATHGDDHFFPGPVDIAWDLAGAIVEWGMSAAAAQYMLDRYRQRSGDDARARIQAYLLAYAVFRVAYCEMAAFTMRGCEEEPRLRRAGLRYRRLVEAQLQAPGIAPASIEDGWNQRRPGVESAPALGDSGADAA